MMRDLRPVTLRRDLCEATARRLARKGWLVSPKVINVAMRAIDKLPKGSSEADLLEAVAQAFARHSRPP
jgi:hypothetical protein